MSRRQTALKIAPTVVGKTHDEALAILDQHQLGVRFIVMDGRKCGINTTVESGCVCLFTNQDDIVFKAVVGSAGIYDDADYLAAQDSIADPDN